MHPYKVLAKTAAQVKKARKHSQTINFTTAWILHHNMHCELATAMQHLIPRVHVQCKVLFANTTESDCTSSAASNSNQSNFITYHKYPKQYHSVNLVTKDEMLQPVAETWYSLGGRIFFLPSPQIEKFFLKGDGRGLTVSWN